MTQNNLAHIAQQMFGTPLLIEPGKARVIGEAFGPRVLGVHVNLGDTSASEVPAFRPSAGSILDEGMSNSLLRDGGGFTRHRGVAIIEVIGTCVRRGSWLGQSSGMTSYEGLRAQIKSAAADPEIKAIALEFDTPGGEAAGAFELAHLVRKVRNSKPVYAFCAQNAFSAGYALASQSSRIVVPEFGGAGSIGCVMMHAEMSRKLEKDGVTVTIIRSGARKMEGSPVEPLPAELLAEWQSRSDRMRVAFAELVGLGRGRSLDTAAALKTEARCYEGAEAVSLGIADQVADPKEAFDAMVAAVNETGEWDGSMSSPTAHIVVDRSVCLSGELPPPSLEGNEMSQLNSIDASSIVTEMQVQETNVSHVQTADPVKVIDMVAKAGLPASFASELVASKCSMESAQAKVIDRMADSSDDGSDIFNRDTHARVVTDGTERMRAGMVEAICAKAGLEGGAQNEFSSMNLREMARATLQSRGLSLSGFRGSSAMVGAAFVPTMAGGLHGTSDFGLILQDVANKAMLKGFQQANENFNLFTSQGVLTDFKPTQRVALGVFDLLDELGEDAEFKHGTIGEYGEMITLATYGKLFSITRQAIINDDLSVFTKIPALMGGSAKRTIGNLVYTLLNEGQTLRDGGSLFSTEAGNLAATAGAPSEATIDAGLTAMATQKAPGAKEGDDLPLNIQPKYLLANTKQRAAVLRSLMSEKSPDTKNEKGPQSYNTVHRAAEPLLDARIKGDAWFLAADPSLVDTIEVSYLDGITEPYLEQKNGWSVDGTSFKVRLDAGVGAMGRTGLYKNAGR
jgi:ClpP class serine protease